MLCLHAVPTGLYPLLYLHAASCHIRHPQQLLQTHNKKLLTSPSQLLELLFPFAADQVDNQCSQRGGGYKEPYFPYLICKEPELHQLLVDVAVGGAQAFIHSQRPADMSHSVLLRIDIALTWHGDQVSFPHMQSFG